jgi:YcaO-like protein with predicted kinase domain
VTGKAHRRGTHRAVCPGETVARLQPRLGDFGITRIADVTGLDRIGLPVMMVVRPRSRSNAVSQGKGLDLQAATASGLMEAIETWHAERVEAEVIATRLELESVGAVVDVGGLPPRRDRRFHAELPIPWVRGTDIGADDHPVWVPYELVHTDYEAKRSRCFCASTNGLASGNTWAEAMVHAVAEVIERDALAVWHHAGRTRQAASRIDLATIDDLDCLEVIELLEAADLAVAVHDVTSDVGVAAFHVEIVERGERRATFFPRPAAGSGCHPTRNIALVRALTEAVQSRLTYIASSRDDLRDEDYDVDPTRIDRARARVLDRAGSRSFGQVSSFDGGAFEDDLRHLISQLASAGFSQIAMVDLSRPDFEQIAVVRVVIPGLATLVDHPHAAPSPRTRRANARHLALLAEPMM